MEETISGDVEGRICNDARKTHRWKLRVVCLLVGLSNMGCDERRDSDDSSNVEGRSTGVEQTSSGAAGSSASSSSGDTDVVPWSPPSGCPENTWYQCSTAPEYDWMLDANGCLLSGCTPDAEDPGCPEGEECLPTDECMSLVAGCADVDGACVCETDPTCFDYACQLPG